MRDHRIKRGMVLGKFMPVSNGHLHLIHTAQQLCDELYVVVGSQPSEDLPGELRHSWVEFLCPGVTVLHLHKELPQKPEEHPDFWALWTSTLKDTLGFSPDVVFAGEPYGKALARNLGAEFIYVPRTTGLCVSATQIREDPESMWEHVPPIVRSHYAKRIRIVGPESSGKTTLAKVIAKKLNATYVAEFAMGYIAMGGGINHKGMLSIARGQAASEDALCRYGKPVLVCDTDPLSTVAWSEALLGSAQEELQAVPQGREYYKTFLVAPTREWVDGNHRLQPDYEQRLKFFHRCKELYPDAIVLEGPWGQRNWRALIEFGIDTGYNRLRNAVQSAIPDIQKQKAKEADAFFVDVNEVINPHGVSVRQEDGKVLLYNESMSIEVGDVYGMESVTEELEALVANPKFILAFKKLYKETP